MSLPHAILGLINYRPATGYDVKNTFKKSIHFFWNATLPQIYRTLRQMEADGWVTSVVEHQDGKPSRKIYHVTDSGQREFARWLAQPPEAPEPRSSMLVKVFFGNRMSPEQFARQVTQWREYHVAVLERFEKEVPPVVTDYSTRMGSDADARYWRFTLDFGRRHAQMVIEWCDQVLKAREPARKEELNHASPGLSSGTE